MNTTELFAMHHAAYAIVTFLKDVSYEIHVSNCNECGIYWDSLNNKISLTFRSREQRDFYFQHIGNGLEYEGGKVKALNVNELALDRAVAEIEQLDAEAKGRWDDE